MKCYDYVLFTVSGHLSDRKIGCRLHPEDLINYPVEEQCSRRNVLGAA